MEQANLNFSYPRKLDLTFIADKPIEARTPEEQALLDLAATDRDVYIEVSDLKKNPALPSPTLSQGAAIHGKSGPLLMADYYRRVLSVMVRERIGSEASQEFVDQLTQVIWLNSNGIKRVADAEPMLDRLFHVLNRFNGKYSQVGKVLFCHLWTTLYNLGRAHERWIKQGNKPILPGEEMNRFIEQMLTRLENGVIDFGLLLPDQALTMAAAYDVNRDAISTVRPIMATELSEGVILEKVYLDMTLSHEFFHSYQDAGNRPMTYADLETEAEIFSTKCLIVLYGEDTTQYLMENSNAWIARAMKQGGLGPPLLQPTEGEPPLVTDLLGIVDDYFKNHTAEFAEINNFRTLNFAIAREEIKTGRAAVEARQRYAEIYSQHKVIALFSTILIHTLNQAALTLPRDPVLVPVSVDEKILPPLSTFKTILVSETGSAPANDLEVFCIYLEIAAKRLIRLYLQYGQDEAERFLSEQFMPFVLSEESRNAYGLTDAGLNGLKRKPLNP